MRVKLAFADGLTSSGFSVDRATLTGATPAHPQGYTVIGIVSNTSYWTPDLPTLHYLDRAQLDRVAVVGLIGGAGSTGRSEHGLRAALERTGATVLGTQSFWLMRPNDKLRLSEPNRRVALDRAKQLAAVPARQVLARMAPTR